MPANTLLRVLKAAPAAVAASAFAFASAAVAVARQLLLICAIAAVIIAVNALLSEKIASFDDDNALYIRQVCNALLGQRCTERACKQYSRLLLFTNVRRLLLFTTSLDAMRASAPSPTQPCGDACYHA